MAVNRESSVALYHQVANDLRAQIASNQYVPGDLLPSEQALMSEYSVSRITIRQALDVLQAEGLLYRIHGKGTYVSHPQVSANFSIVDSFTHDVQALGKEPGVVLLEQGTGFASTVGAKALNVAEDQQVLTVVRLRTADNDPIALIKSWLNDLAFPGLRYLDYRAQSLYQLFEEGLGLKLARARTRVLADIATHEERAHLQISAASPVLRIFRTTYIWKEEQGEIPIEYATAVFDGRQYSVEF